MRVQAVLDMRPQPEAPAAFMRAAGMNMAGGTSNGLGVSTTPGGSMIYWRED